MVQFSLLRLAAVLSIGGGLLTIAVPAFVKGLSSSKLAEAMDGLARVSTNAVAKADGHAHEESFPPGVPLTPAEVPRGVKVKDPPGTWDHLTWHALDFRVDEPHAYAYRFDSSVDPVSRTARFAATAHGDLDGDGRVSTFQVQGDRRPDEPARVLPGMLVAQELE